MRISTRSRPAKEIEETLQADPECAIAYWGIA
jgi:hypothetical protein